MSLDFGDGTVQSLTLTRGLAVTTHAFATAGLVTVNAQYSGDSVFAAQSAQEHRVVLDQAPASANLNTFGSSTTAGSAASSVATEYASLVAAAEGWSLSNHAGGGATVATSTQAVYGTTVSTNSHSSLLIGRNEINLVGPSAVSNAEYIAALTANYAWMLAPNGSAQKVVAQSPSVIQKGSWSKSDTFPGVGLVSIVQGSQLTFTVQGNVVYVGLSSKNGDARFAISVAGQSFGVYQPTVTIGSPEVFGVRIPLPGSNANLWPVTVTCQTVGSSGCYVDFVSGNGAAVPLQPPYLWVMSPENEVTALPQAWYDLEESDVRQLASQFASDGFSIFFGNLNERFSGLASPECFASDALHPLDCGHAIIAATLIAAINPLNAAVQRINFPAPATTLYVGNTSLLASATSGLPVTYTVVSGNATINGSVLTTTAPGSVVVAAHQGGNSAYLPAPDVSRSLTFVSVPISVTAQLGVTGFGSPAALLQPGLVTVTALDSSGKLTSNFLGTVTFSSTDSAASLPASYTFTAADAGSHTFRISLGTPGLQTITATAGAFSGSETSILVTGSTWIVNQNGTVSRLNGVGSLLGLQGAAVSSGTSGGIAIDQTGNAWSVVNSSNTLTFVNPAASASTSYTGAGLAQPVAVAIDGAGQIWVANTNNSLSAFSSTGTALTPATGFHSNSMNLPSAIAVDQLGTLWITNLGNSTVTHIFGGAVPVVAPLVTGVTNGTTGSHP